MQKYKQIHLILTAVLLAVFTLGTIGTGVLLSRISSEDMGASVLTAKKKTKRKRSAARKLFPALLIDTGASEVDICNYTLPQQPEYKGEFIAKETKIQTEPGEKFEVALYLKNTGNTAWFGDRSECHSIPHMRLGTARDRDHDSLFYNPGDSRWIQGNRIAMVEPRVEPGEIATFKFSSKAPWAADIFREFFQPVIDGVKWLETKEETAYVDIYIGAVTEENERALFYLGKTGQASSINPNGELFVDVDISDQRMLVFLGDTIIREYMVSTGTFQKPTPTGSGKIVEKQELRIANKYPHYRMPFWQSLAFDKHGGQFLGYGFHSLPYLANDKGVFWNEALNHIGQRVSSGCVRILPENAEDLFNITKIGTKFLIHD